MKKKVEVCIRHLNALTRSYIDLLPLVGFQIACISTLANCDMFATSTLHGHVVVWDCARVLKVGSLHIQL